MGRRAILYARVSTPRQAELYSLEYQLEQEREYAHSMGFIVVAELTDDSSGRKIERDNLSVARELLADNKADVLVTWKLDRLHRSYINTVILRDEIQRMGKELHYAQMRMKSGTTAKQRLPEDVLALMAEIEADEIAERTAMGKREKAAKGGKWIGLNRAPYGYRAVGKGKDVALAIDEEKAEVVRTVFTWYVHGDNGSAPLSTIKIAEKLRARGVPTPGDSDPNHVHLKQRGYGEWTQYIVMRILRESAYMGVYYHFKTKKVGGKSLANPNREEWVGVPVPVIIDAALYEDAQAKLAKGREMASRGAKFAYLLGRRIWCQCGYKMRSSASGSQHKGKNGHTKDYFYHRYVCPAAKKYRVRSCDMPPVEVKDVDSLVWQWVKETIADPQILVLRLAEIQQEEQKEGKKTHERLVKLYQHRLALEREMKRVLTLFTRGDLPQHLLDELLSEQTAKLKSTQDEIAKTEREAVTPLTDETITDLVAFSTDFRQRLETVEQSFEMKRTVIDGLDVRVVVEKETDGIYLRVSSLLGNRVLLLPVLRLS